MRKLDHQLTENVRRWLMTPAADHNIASGAEMLLALTRNRALHNSFLRKPAKFMPKVEYELRKHLEIRLRDMSGADVAALESRVIPRVAQTVGSLPTISSDDDFPEGTKAKGRRPDHDMLPQEIRDLWESNGPRYRKIVLLFNELKAMADMQPCDRFEKLAMLDDLDSRYRENLALYDAYDPAEPEAAAKSAEQTKKVNAARKTLSKYKKRLLSMPADDPSRAEALGKAQAAVDTILASGAGFTDLMKAELHAIGITFLT